MRSEKLCCCFLGECKFVWLCNRYMRAVMNLECNVVLQHFWLSHSCISTLLTLTSALFSAIFIFKMIFSRACLGVFFPLLGSSASLLGFVGLASILGVSSHYWWFCDRNRVCWIVCDVSSMAGSWWSQWACCFSSPWVIDCLCACDCHSVVQTSPQFCFYFLCSLGLDFLYFLFVERLSDLQHL